MPSRVKTPPLASVRPLSPPEDVLARAHRDGAHYVVSGPEGEAALTLVPSMQESLRRTLSDYQTPWAAVVVLEPSTGRVLAMVEHSEAAPGLRGLPVKAVFPAASVFKLVTASALLDEGVRPDDESCYHGGKRRVSESLLADSSRDRECVSLSEALGRSANVVFAKLTHRYLDADKLRAAAELFRFNRPIPFAIPTEPSLAAVPDEPLELAAHRRRLRGRVPLAAARSADCLGGRERRAVACAHPLRARSRDRARPGAGAERGAGQPRSPR